MKNTRMFLTFAISATALLMISCGPKDNDKLGEAQACLDNATQATVGDCVSDVEGMESARAYLIRCAAGFISQGFDKPSRLASAFNQLDNKNNASGADPTLAMMSFMAFTASSDVATNKADAASTLDYCQKSGSSGLQMLATLSQMATTISSAISGFNPATFDPTSATAQQDMKNAVTNLINSGDPAAATTIGSAVVVAYSSNCTGNGTGNADVCKDLTQAIADAGTTDPTVIGTKMMTLLKNGNN